MTTEERIENLEKGLASARRLNRWLLAAVGLALGVWILAGTLGPTTAGAQGVGAVVNEVRAKRFVLVDDAGQARGSLAVAENGSALTLCDMAGKVRAELSVVPPAGTGLTLYDTAGKARVGLVVLPADNPRIRVGIAASKTRAQLAAAPDVPQLRLYDSSGNCRVLLNVELETPLVGLYDAAGRPIGSAR